MITSHLNAHYFIPITITTINQYLNSFKCMLNYPLLLAFCWNPISSLMLHSWAINHTKISDLVSLSLNLHYWVYDYFTPKILLYFDYYYKLLIKAIISNAYYIFIRSLLWFLDFGFNDFIGLKNTSVAVGPRGPMLSSGRNSPKTTQA